MIWVGRDLGIPFTRPGRPKSLPCFGRNLVRPEVRPVEVRGTLKFDPSKFGHLRCDTKSMSLLPDTWNCGLRMRRECWERFPRHWLQRQPPVSYPGMHHGTCVTHVPWCMSGSVTRHGGENVPGIPGACATLNFTYLARGSWLADPNIVWGIPHLHCILGDLNAFWGQAATGANFHLYFSKWQSLCTALTATK